MRVGERASDNSRFPIRLDGAIQGKAAEDLFQQFRVAASARIESAIRDSSSVVSAINAAHAGWSGTAAAGRLRICNRTVCASRKLPRGLRCTWS